MKTLSVELGARSYPIYIGQQLLDQANLLVQHINGQQVMVVSNETVAPLYLDRVLASLQGFKIEHCILPDGEQYKTFDVMQRIFDALLSVPCDRRTTVIALGGGVIGDITGFAAACYQRGVAFIQIPTTLLAQVDSSVGGKTAVNHPMGKNMIGAFYQPQAVIADTTTLNTLNDRELRAGLAEVIKYGLIRDIEFLDWLEQNYQAILGRDAEALAYAIEQSCRNKAEVVAADEREHGERATLNLGHTFGHAIETAAGYGEWLHGEAIAAGMVMAADLSCRLGWLDQTDVNRATTLLKKSGLPIAPPSGISRDQFLSHMAVDKKVLDGQLRLVLLQELGQATVTADYDRNQLIATLDNFVS